jgi:LPXTG-motif cell wall-anchored protein
VNDIGSPVYPPSSNGSPTGIIVGGALIVALGVAGGVIAWRRRRRPT